MIKAFYCDENISKKPFAGNRQKNLLLKSQEKTFFWKVKGSA